jgi:hypothetical protein
MGGLLLDVTGIPAANRDNAAALITEIGQYGPGGRACYGPAPARPQVWSWEGDIP